MSTDLLRVETLDKKYAVILTASGHLYAERYGQPWRECVGDTLILTLAQDCETLSERNRTLAEQHAETVRLLSKSAELLKLSADKLHHYAKRQGKTRMAGKTFADGSVRNPNEGQHYPAVQSYLDQIRAHLAALQLTVPVKSAKS